ncbi:MAG TPA: ATP synthase F1 subunit epsilon [Saprospiraceae bacterium]|nr:ATP synthase F1 subunit epsilon [Saprospiraceae bacterium]
MKLVVLTPGKELFKGDVESVKVPGTKGQFEILNGHSPIVSSLAKGTIRIKTSEGASKEFKISKGFVEVLKNEVSLLVQLPTVTV